MPMDFNYTSAPEAHPVYHVLVMCPEAMNIHTAHRKYGNPPASDRRQPCHKCVDTIGEWFDEIRA